LRDEDLSKVSGQRQENKTETRNNYLMNHAEKRPLPSQFFRLAFTARVLEKIHSENFIFYGNSK
jgi:hypothetical protein